MPRRKKPLYRPRNIILLIIALLPARQAYLAITATPGQAVSYSSLVDALFESYQPVHEGPNAVDLLNQAGDILKGVEAEHLFRNPSDPTDTFEGYCIEYRYLWESGPPGDLQRTSELHTRQVIDECRRTALLDVLSRAAATPRALHTAPRGPLIYAPDPPILKTAFRLFDLSLARMLIAAREHNGVEAASAFEHALAIARIASYGTVRARWMNTAALEELRREVVDGLYDEPTLSVMLQIIDRQPLPPIKLNLEYARLCLLDTIQWSHTDDGQGSGRLIPSALSYPGVPLKWDEDAGLRGASLIAGLLPTKADNIRIVERFYDVAFAAAEHPRHEPAGGSSPHRIPWWYPALWLRGDLRTTEPAGPSGVYEHAMREGTRVMLAIEIFRSRYGNCPSALADLVPSILPEVPLDPDSGRPFCYRPITDDRGRPTYILYLVGFDQADNSGTHNIDAFYPDLKVSGGYDFVLNSPRPVKDWK